MSPRKRGSSPELIAEISLHSVAILGIRIEAHYYTFPFSSELAKLNTEEEEDPHFSVSSKQITIDSWLILNWSLMMFYIFKVS